MKLQTGLSKNELQVLREIALERTYVKDIAGALGKSRPQTYRILKHLIEGGFIEKEGRKVALQKHSFIPILVQILRNDPKIIPLLADSGIVLLKEMLEPSSIANIEEKTGLKQAIIYRKFREANKFSIIIKERRKYSLNSKIWPELNEFLEGYRRYALRIAPNLGADVLIRGKYGRVVIAETTKELKNASPTAFSVYPKYGITILMPSNYYHFPKEKLNISQVFLDSLIILEDDREYRKTLYAILFYIKNKSKLKGVKHEIIYKLQKVLKGEAVEGFPSLEEIKEKAEQYDVQI